MGFPGGSDSKESAWNAEPGSIPEYERSLEKEMAAHSNSCPWENPMDRGAWRATVHGVTQSRT